MVDRIATPATPGPSPLASAPKLLDRVRQAIRTRHYSRRTETAYVAWIRRFIVFHGKRHPRELGGPEVTAFVSSLAARGVSASTQNQALSAVLFLFEVVLGQRVGWMDTIIRAASGPRARRAPAPGGVLAAVPSARARVADGLADVWGRAEAARVRRASGQGHQL
jgi:Phage integrase, N-terminal SAM-like domain